MSEEMKDAKAEIRKAQEASGQEIKDVYYNEEEMKELDGYLGLIPESHLYYTPEVFKKLPKEKQPVFKYRAHNQSDEIALLEAIEEKHPVPMKVLVKRCLKGWKNFRDKKGHEIKFEMDGEQVSEKCLDRVTVNLLVNIGVAISNNDSLTDAEMVGLEF